MVTNVRCNVEDYRVHDNGLNCEDVTSFTPPTIEHPTTQMKTNGVIMDIDVPNKFHFNAMEFEISHNNGTNCNRLRDPGKHQIETRIARQKYVTTQGETELELIKVRALGLHKSTAPGSIETGNPYGSTEKYSVIRYEEEIDGEIITLIDSTAGIIRFNGVEFTDELSSLLD